MKSIFAAAAAILSFATAHPAAAALAVGDSAPLSAARGAKGGTIMTVDLAELLKNGPVVVFFFPSAFTDGPECRAFADNIDKFRAAGVSVLGASRDSADTLARFSLDECAGKFPVVSADEGLVNGFDVNDGAMFNSRTTYVITPAGKIAFVHDGEDFGDHVTAALAFVQGMKSRRAL
jgi:peroxiredoxin Q/BCP